MSVLSTMPVVLVLLAGTLAVPAAAQPAEARPSGEIETRVYVTRRIAGRVPVVDGRVDEEVWNTVDWSGGFIQRDPADGEAPAYPSEFKAVYDDQALYFAFRLHDDPRQVTPLLARRDWFPGDWIEVNVDSYHDHRTAYSFTLSLSGTRGDEYISQDGNSWNASWDPVWSGATQVDEEGWTAEMRIPLGQLRFSNAAEQTWGLQVQRRLFRLEERSTWQRIPKDATGWVSRFGELRGLTHLKPRRRIELLPYVVASTEHTATETGNPFRDGSASDLDGGIDGKIGVGSNLTLDFTVNPDFGQVEADPSEVNLTEYESYFREQRPFFVEGSNILDLRIAPAITGGSFTQDTLFYSRRIGRRPSHSPDVPDEAWVDLPQYTTILGAFKLSGRTASGLSIGLLESVTAKEEAAVDLAGERSKLTVEPWTNYFVGRLQQDFNQGNTQVGGMLTAAHRALDDEHLDDMTREAYTGGLDLSTYFKDRDYLLELCLLGSELRGSAEAIAEVQTASARYYQRPDNDSASYDPTRRSLSGHAGSVRFRRTNNHVLVFQTGVAWRSPGFEINDLGYMRNADQINQFTWVGYRKRHPFGIFDNWSLNGNQWLDWDFAGNFLGARYNINSNAQFRNKYSVGMGVTRAGEQISNTMLRGGPSSRWPGAWSWEVWANSDHRKDLRFNLGAYTSRGDNASEDDRQAWMTVTYRPTNAISLSLSPTFSASEAQMQYIATESFGQSDRYLFGNLDQKTFSLTLRLDCSITPNLTVQLYAAPFVSTGRYRELKRITDPRAAEYRDRFRTFDGAQLTYDPVAELYEIDEDRNGTIDYSIDNPDFDVREFNSNLVIRWEYSPGSTAYLVWSQARANSGLLVDELSIRDDMRHLFATHPHNVILLKVSRWFSP